MVDQQRFPVQSWSKRSNIPSPKLCSTQPPFWVTTNSQVLPFLAISDNVAKAKSPQRSSHPRATSSVLQASVSSHPQQKGPCFWPGIAKASSSRVLLCAVVTQHRSFALFLLSHRLTPSTMYRTSSSYVHVTLLTHLLLQMEHLFGVFGSKKQWKRTATDWHCPCSGRCLHSSEGSIWTPGQPKQGKYLSLVVNIIFPFLTFP